MKKAPITAADQGLRAPNEPLHACAQKSRLPIAAHGCLAEKRNSDLALAGAGLRAVPGAQHHRVAWRARLWWIKALGEGVASAQMAETIERERLRLDTVKA